MQLDNARILITGGSSGIGYALAEICRNRGARVVINGRDEARLREAGEALGVDTAGGDVGREDDARSIVEAAAAALGGIDVLVNNAGWGKSLLLDKLEAREFQSMWETNVLGAALMAREALPHLKRATAGSIVNIGSTAAKKGFAGGTAYAATKFALAGMSQCWQAELRPANIRVMLINPSEVQTSFGGPAAKQSDPHKLVAIDVAHAIAGALEMADRGFIPEMTIYATNPWRES